MSHTAIMKKAGPKKTAMIFKALDRIEKLIGEKDPQGCAWDLRVAVMTGIFSAFDAPRFRMEPADPEEILLKLKNLMLHIEQTPIKSQKIVTEEKLLLRFKDNEEKMQYLYGLAFGALSEEQYMDAAGLLYNRLHGSNKDVSFIRGAECLDIATGTGRYALAMVQLGAKRVTGIDFSKYCLDEARNRLRRLPEYRNITLLHKDLYKLPKYMNEAFDFVCMNGVIHHTPNPYESLNVAARCTRKGGHAFVFVFSKNDAPFWPSIELMRKISVPVPMDYAHTTLKSYELPGTKIFNILDYSYTPIQHKLDRKRFEERLRSLFSRVDFLDGGSVHDSAFRCKMFGSDKHIYGISEIRYLLQK